MPLQEKTHHKALSAKVENDLRTDSERLQAWIEDLPFERPGLAARALVNELRHLRHPTNIRARLKLLEPTVEAAGRLTQEIGKVLSTTSLPMSPEMQQVFLGVNALLKTLATSYAQIADDIIGKWIGLGFTKPLQLATVRAMHFQALRLDLAYRVYARLSNSSWLELHRLYGIARAENFATLTPQGTGATAELIYINALLLAFAEPTKMAPGELDRVRFYVKRHAKYAEILDANSDPALRHNTVACFLIKPTEARAGRSLIRATQLPIAAGDLILRCTKLETKLQTQLNGIERGIEPAKLGLPLAARQSSYITVLRNLQNLWNAPPIRRFSRQNFKPRVDMVVGFDALWSFLIGPALRRRTADGHKTEESDSLIELSEWAIGNESPGGFSLQYIGGNACRVSVGELIGLRPREKATVHVCITRRVVSDDLQSLELGLQNLAPMAVPSVITVPESGKNGAAPVLRQVPVILLPRMPGQGEIPAIIAPAQVLKRGMTIHVPKGKEQIAFKVATTLEQCASCEIFTLLPLNAKETASPRETVHAHSAASF